MHPLPRRSTVAGFGLALVAVITPTALADETPLNGFSADHSAAERTLTRPEGLPGRPWYIHQVYAPGRYTWYGVKTPPAVREAIELRQFDAADEQIKVVAGVLAGAAAQIDRATAIVRGPAGRPVTLTK